MKREHGNNNKSSRNNNKSLFFCELTNEKKERIIIITSGSTGPFVSFRFRLCSVLLCFFFTLALCAIAHYTVHQMNARARLCVFAFVCLRLRTQRESCPSPTIVLLCFMRPKTHYFGMNSPLRMNILVFNSLSAVDKE